ncbi:MAG TPA: hypothetical protein VGK79_12040 [Gaiellaceae bacterium]|jgi:hypothetical protein
MWRAVAVALLVSAGAFAVLTVWTNHTTASAHERSREFAQDAKSICEQAPHTPAGLRRAADEIAALDAPRDLHRAVARLELHWRRLLTSEPGSKAYRAELKQARLSAHLLNVTACRSIAPH